MLFIDLAQLDAARTVQAALCGPPPLPLLSVSIATNPTHPRPHAVQGCALWHNWWPMLTAFVYVLVSSGRLCSPTHFLQQQAERQHRWMQHPTKVACCWRLQVPMPYLFFSGGAGGSNLASGWQDAGRFLVGFSAVMVSGVALCWQPPPLRCWRGRGSLPAAQGCALCTLGACCSFPGHID